MKLDLKAKICDISGKETEGAPTLGSVITQALITLMPGDENLDGTEKVRLFALALAVNSNADHDFSVEDVALMKNRIGRGFGPVVVGRAWQMLDPAVK